MPLRFLSSLSPNSSKPVHPSLFQPFFFIFSLFLSSFLFQLSPDSLNFFFRHYFPIFPRFNFVFLIFFCISPLLSPFLPFFFVFFLFSPLFFHFPHFFSVLSSIFFHFSYIFRISTPEIFYSIFVIISSFSTF